MGKPGEEPLQLSNGEEWLDLRAAWTQNEIIGLGDGVNGGGEESWITLGFWFRHLCNCLCLFMRGETERKLKFVGKRLTFSFSPN